VVLSRCLDKLHLKCGEASFLFWMRITRSPERLELPDPVTPQSERDENIMILKRSTMSFIDPSRTQLLFDAV